MPGKRLPGSVFKREATQSTFQPNPFHGFMKPSAWNAMKFRPILTLFSEKQLRKTRGVTSPSGPTGHSSSHHLCNVVCREPFSSALTAGFPQTDLQGPSHSQTLGVVTVDSQKCSSGPRLSRGRMSNMLQGKNLSTGNCSEWCPQRRVFSPAQEQRLSPAAQPPAEPGTSIQTGSDSEAEHPSYLCITSV